MKVVTWAVGAATVLLGVIAFGTGASATRGGLFEPTCGGAVICGLAFLVLAARMGRRAR